MVPEWVQIASIGPQMAQNGPKLIKIAPPGPKFAQNWAPGAAPDLAWLGLIQIITRMSPGDMERNWTPVIIPA